MKSSFSLTILLQKGEKYWLAFCPEVPGANGQGKTKAEAIDDLKEAILLIWECNREEGMQDVPPDTVCEKLTLA